MKIKIYSILTITMFGFIFCISCDKKGTEPEPDPANEGVIAFDSKRTGNGDIYVMDADGSNPRRLTTSDEVEYWPSWSPDGKRIAYSDGDINVINLDGTGLTKLTTHSAPDWEPAWSPDGNHIAWSSMRDGNAEMYLMNADGSNKVRLTSNNAIDGYPSWSPDGKKIAFSTDRDGNWEIYVMDADGSNQTRVTNTSYNEWRAVWSPDGDKFVISTDLDDGIFIMNVDGSGLTRMTDQPAINASWIPDGSGIIFNSNITGSHEIYILEILSNMEVGNITQLTQNNVDDGHPVWRAK